MALLSDDWVKVGVATLTTTGAILTFLNTWRKERKIDLLTKEAARDIVPSTMQILARAGTPMPALQIDQTNDMMATMERLNHRLDRNLEETRRNIALIGEMGSEIQRLQEELRHSRAELKREKEKSHDD